MNLGQFKKEDRLVSGILTFKYKEEVKVFLCGLRDGITGNYEYVVPLKELYKAFKEESGVLDLGKYTFNHIIKSNIKEVFSDNFVVVNKRRQEGMVYIFSKKEQNG